jgi:uncharacterized repeat protein (TIGR01451 family)
MKRLSIVFLTAFFLAASLAPAWSANGVTMTQSVKRQVETVNEQGEKVIVLEELESAVPGEELVIIIAYVNGGDVAAGNISINNPLSESLVYTGGSAEGESTTVTFSVDGGKSFDLPVKLFITNQQGEKVPALPADYTHILWKRTAPLAPGQKAEVRFRAVVK